MSERIKPEATFIVWDRLQSLLCDQIESDHPMCATNQCGKCIYNGAPLDEFKTYLKAELEREA